MLDRALSEIGGKGLFTEEIETGLADGSIDIAVMSENNFQRWQTGETPDVIYSPGLTPRASFRLPIEDSGTYYLIFSNTQASDSRVVKSEIFLFSTIDVGEL